MKTTLLLLCVVALMFQGCATDGTAKLVRELAKDPATVKVKIITPYGMSLDFERSFPTNYPFKP